MIVQALGKRRGGKTGVVGDADVVVDSEVVSTEPELDLERRRRCGGRRRAQHVEIRLIQGR